MKLCSNRLCVQVAEPGTFYSGTRFDWTGFITQVTLDGRHTFCVPESLDSSVGSGGVGMCNEFGIFRPVGYDEAAPGECFPKFGVGLLQRESDEAYDFMHLYSLTPFTRRVTSGEGWARMESEPLPCRGYAAREVKTLRVEENTLSIAYELENVGTQAIRTHEYCHNFLAIDGRGPGEGCVLRVAQGLSASDTPDLLQQEGSTVRWLHAPEASFLCRFFASGQAPGKIDGPVWELSLEPEGVAVSEALSAPVAGLSLWCASHVASPEVFVDIDIEPGQTQSWTRTYRFTGPGGS